MGPQKDQKKNQNKAQAMGRSTWLQGACTCKALWARGLVGVCSGMVTDRRVRHMGGEGEGRSRRRGAQCR